jgi:hypothetical protein
MAARNPQARATPETQTLDQPVMAHHFGGKNVLWDELADEARHYLELVDALKKIPVDHPDRDVLETALYGSLSHLEIHARVMNETINADQESEP